MRKPVSTTLADRHPRKFVTPKTEQPETVKKPDFTHVTKNHNNINFNRQA